MRISDWSSDVCSSDLGGVPEDSRITTRYDEADFAQALMGVLHETGHAMYARARPNAWRYQPVGEARDRQRVVKGKSVSVRVDLGGRRIIKQKKHRTIQRKPTLLSKHTCNKIIR